jgi:hypothetical protein
MVILSPDYTVSTEMVQEHIDRAVERPNQNGDGVEEAISCWG